LASNICHREKKEGEGEIEGEGEREGEGGSTVHRRERRGVKRGEVCNNGADARRRCT